MKKIFAIILFIFSLNSFSQQKQVIEGEVSYISTSNVYLKFDDTSGFQVGDTIYVSDQKSEYLIIKNKSSRSVLAENILGLDIEVGAKISHVKIPKSKKENITPIIEENINTKKDSSVVKPKSAKRRNFAKVSVSSYSNFDDQSNQSHRIVERLNIYAKNISGSNFSFYTYLNNSNLYTANDSTKLYNNDNRINIYSLALKYENESFMAVFGRNINNKVSSLGAIDGLQFEKKLSFFYIGLIAGFRPGFSDFEFNSNLLQYGGYFGYSKGFKNFSTTTTLGVIEQKNSGNVDRRYAYMQHSSRIFNDLSVFSSLEVDIYNKIDSVTTQPLRLTNFYVSTRYTVNKYVSLLLSFDSRKQIIYYETYQSTIDQMLDEDLARQGLRAGISLRPYRNIFTGFNYSKRFESSTQNKSDNYNAYFTYSNLPFIGGRISLSYNDNKSNYANTKVIGTRYSKDFFNGVLNSEIYYRNVNYDYGSDISKFQNNYYGTSFNIRFTRNLMFSLFGEYSKSKISENLRINSKLILRL